MLQLGQTVAGGPTTSQITIIGLYQIRSSFTIQTITELLTIFSHVDSSSKVFCPKIVFA